MVVDAVMGEAVTEFFNNRPRIATAEETLALFQQRASELPAQPRLWRVSLVKEWAKNAGREWHGEPERPGSDAASGG